MGEKDSNVRPKPFMKQSYKGWVGIPMLATACLQCLVQLFHFEKKNKCFRFLSILSSLISNYAVDPVYINEQEGIIRSRYENVICYMEI